LDDSRRSVAAARAGVAKAAEMGRKAVRTEEEKAKTGEDGEKQEGDASLGLSDNIKVIIDAPLAIVFAVYLLCKSHLGRNTRRHLRNAAIVINNKICTYSGCSA